MQLWEIRGGRLYQGDVIEVLKQLPDNSVDVIITSPPYWAKRDYGPSNNRVWGGVPNCEHEWTTVEGAPTKLFKSGHTDKKYEVVNRLPASSGMVCRKCGAWYGQLGLEPTPQMFVEHLTEIFEEAKRVLKPTGSLFVNIDDTWLGSGSGNDTPKPSTTPHLGKRKSLALVPELFATSMVYEHGWILREKIIWTKKVYFYKEGRQKGNAMPEPVRDRFTHSWEFVFHFTKKPRYYFNWDDVSPRNNTRPVDTVLITPKPFKGAHFAVFPPELPELLIKAACPEGGTVLDPFAGSGTTLVVAERLGRKWVGIEINPEYCAIIRRRLDIGQRSLEGYI